MNPFVKIEFDPASTVESELLSADAGKLSAVVYGHATWQEAVTINKMTRQIKQAREGVATPAFYSVCSSGLYGFCFADVGPSLSFT